MAKHVRRTEEHPSGSVLERIRTMGERLSPKQRQLARFVVESGSEAAFMNSVALAAAAGVSDATVSRLATALGYTGFAEFQAGIQALLQEDISSLRRFPLDRESSGDTLFAKVFALEAGILNETRDAVDAAAYERAVNLLSGAKKVLVVGYEPNACVASYAAFFLGVLRANVQSATTLDVRVFNAVQDIGPDSVALVFSFPRYPRRIQTTVEFLKAKGVPVIGITDSVLSPLAPLSDVLFPVPMKFITFIDPLAGAMALVHSLLIGVFLKDAERSRGQVRAFEEFAGKDRYFLRQDVDILGLL
jgi:DNA-binding MurR/RpiR family transcriptional regulator